MGKTIRSLIPLVVAGFLLMGVGTFSPRALVFAQSSANDNSLRAEVMNKALSNSKYKNVEVSVHNGIVKLTGTVAVYDIKNQAMRRVQRIKGVTAVENDIVAGGEAIPDAELQQKVLKAVQSDRVGWPTAPFNAISVRVQDGVVTLGGHAYGPVDADTAVATASNIKGVRDVINDIQLDPVSPMDDRIRRAVYRAVYGFPSLNKYAIDPVQPIRISVQNGNVTLYGVVDSQADKNAAGIRANSVSGVFHVTNDLQVRGQVPEQK
ncbi:MAG TPA: BON domain-containing protein [Acidobacteriaceae bacterium]|nr:BON domain-containing protein [Acidobacteriaceae bacterium]